MIIQVEEALLPELYAFCGDTPFGCRVACAALSYGTSYSFARLWLQRQGQNPVAAICKLDGALILDVRSDADFIELSGFLHAIGGESLLCGGIFAQRMTGWESMDTGPVLARNATGAGVAMGDAPGPVEIHRLLVRCGGKSFRVPPFEPFYLDLSHRLRHGTARTAGIRGESGELLACAVTSAETEGMAVISAVAAAPEVRRQGLGARAVNRLLESLGERRAYLFRAETENQEFYEALGFEEWGRWAELQTAKGFFSDEG